jgi:hypothetical protein
LDTYHVVLYIHFLSLFVGVGAVTVLVTCLLQLRAARTVVDAAPWGRVAGKIGRAFPIAILGLFGSGAYMTSDVWAWDTTWIVVGIVSLVVLAIQGPLVAERTGHQLGRTLQENGPGPLGERARRMTLHPGLWVTEFTAIGLVLGNVWNMTTKPGTGSAIAAAVVGYAVGAALAFAITSTSKSSLRGEAQEPAVT